MEQFVRPINIPSPISGFPVVPRLIEKDMGDRIVVEAHWIDPQSGEFIRKGIVEIREKNTLNEYNTSFQENEEGGDGGEFLLRAAEDPDYMEDLIRGARSGKYTGAEAEAASYIYSRYKELMTTMDSEDIYQKISDEIAEDYN